MKKHAMVYWSLCLVAATALVGGRQLVDAAPCQDSAPLDERVAASVKSKILAQGVPSASVAVMRDGKMLLQRAWGLADVDKAVQADAATTYPIASVSKMFTAALVLKQVDRGRLSLNDSIGKHLTGLKPEFHAITIEQLLNHTSGLPNDFRDPDRRLERRSPDELFAMVAATTLANEPGRAYVYSNTGYALLGLLIQKVYGTSYDAVLRDEIARPLGLTLAQCAEPRPGEATGHMRTPDGKIGPPPGLHFSQLLGVGGVCASAGDLVKWTHALHNGRVLSPSTYTAMTTPRGAAVSANYGLGVYVRPAAWGDRAIVGGGVTQNGYVAELHWYPEKATAVALLYNVAPRVPGVSDLIPRIVLGVPLAAPAAAPSPATASETTTPAERTRLVGVYALTPQRTFEVVLENGELYVTPSGGSKQPLVFRSGNTYALGSSDSKTTVTFIVDNGVATAFEANDNGSKRTLKKIE